MRLADVIAGYWLDKRSTFSTRTVEGYSYHFAHLAEFLGDPDFAAITADDVRRFLADLHDRRRLSMRTVHDAWVALNSLWTWAGKELGTPHALRGRVSEPRYTQRVIDPFTEEEIRRMVHATEYGREWTTRRGRRVQSARPTADRDRAIVLTLLDTGLRASELCALTLADYTAARGRLHVRCGKGAKERFVYLGDRARKALWKYLATRAAARNTDPLFCTTTGQPFDRDGLRQLVVRIGVRAGVDHAHPHRFRHTFGISFLRNGGSLLELQQLLGHASLRTVQIYARLAETDLETAGRKHSPADRWRL